MQNKLVTPQEKQTNRKLGVYQFLSGTQFMLSGKQLLLFLKESFCQK